MRKLLLTLSLFCWMALTGCDKDVSKDIEDSIKSIDFGEFTEVDLYLPNQIKDVSVTWLIPENAFLDSTGKVHRPTFSQGDQTITFNGIFSKNNRNKSVEYKITVLKTNELLFDENSIFDQIIIPYELSQSIELVLEIDGYLLQYEMSHPTYLNHQGQLLKRPKYFEKDLLVTIRVSFVKGDQTYMKDYKTMILKEVLGSDEVFGYASLGFDTTFSLKGETGYYVVNNEKEFLEALSQKGSLSASVIEITNDLDLGYEFVRNRYPDVDFDTVIFQSHHSPLTHPTLLKSGISRVSIRDRKDNTQYQKGLKIFSVKGVTIKHASFTVKNSENIWIQNLKFDELWEWDETTKGAYDRNDWDYITIEDSKNIWINRITMHQAYDGLIDVKGYSSNITISNSRFKALVNNFILDQINYLEQYSDKYPFYQSYRDKGLSTEDMATFVSFQKKGHLIGSSEFKPENASLTVTIANNYYLNIQDRIPRLRGGDVHIYHVVHDARAIYDFKQMLSTKGINLTNQGLVTTENGAVLMENSIFMGVSIPIKNSQKTGSNYTGKYLVLNSLFVLKDFEELSNSTDDHSIWKGNVFAMPFGLNNTNEIPYEYDLIEVTDLLIYLEAISIGSTDNH
ncbi:MAG: hypothetical protein RBQ91_00790 [Acholeplasma sp.]|nr:hypothetical protein [Acholeplasma sp.]